jgi:hypothetical protein
MLHPEVVTAFITGSVVLKGAGLGATASRLTHGAIASSSGDIIPH